MPRRAGRQSFVAVFLIVAAVIYALVGIAHPPEGTTITNEAISSYLFKSGQRMTARSNMTETIVQRASIATILELNLSVEALVGNGVDSCTVMATVLDAAGNPVPDGQPVQFVTSYGRFSNGDDTTYTLTVGGIAIVWLKSELLTSSQPVTANITASTLGASGQSLTRFLPMLFYAGGLKGRIVSVSDRPVRGMIVVAYDENRNEDGRDTTESDGKFLIPLTESGMYQTAFRYTNAFGDDIVVYASKSVSIPSSGGAAAVSPLNTIVGSIVDASQAIRRAQVLVMLYGTSSPYGDGRVLPTDGATDDRGVFAFDSLSAGSYEMLVMDIQFSGKSVVQHSDEGTFLIDANIELVDSPTLEVIKTSSKRIAEIGDAVIYTVHVRNLSANAMLFDVRLIDELPVAFVFASNSARRDSVMLPHPSDRRRLEWVIADSLPPAESIEVTYAVTIGSGALDGNGVNKAYAVATDISGREQSSLEASVQVTVRPGVFTDRGIVVGKVFYDENGDGLQDDGEPGISRVELWMEDGTRILTGDDGKYSLPEVRSGQHVLRVNDLTLPYGSELLALKAEFADDGLSRFVRLSEGGIARADFYVKPPAQASAEAVFPAKYATKSGERMPALYALRFGDIGSPTRVLLTDTLPDGYAYDYASIAWRGMKLYPDGVASRFLAIDFPSAHSSDSIHVVIVADTAAVQRTPYGGAKALATSGRLLLAYPRGRDASFTVGQKYEVLAGDSIAPIVPIAQNEVKPTSDTVSISGKTPDTPDTPDTIAQSVPKPDAESKRKISSRKKPSSQRLAQQAPARVDTSLHVAPDSAFVDTPSARQPDRSRLRELFGYDDGKAFTFGERTLKVTGLIASGVLLFLLWLLYRRRKKKKEGQI